MPVKSDAQRRFMYATMAGKTDAPPSVGREFIEESHGLKGLMERVHPKDESKASHRRKIGRIKAK